MSQESPLRKLNRCMDESAGKVRDELIRFNHEQLVKQCEILTEQIKQIHPWLAMDQRVIRAVFTANRTLADLVGGYPYGPGFSTSPNNIPSNNAPDDFAADDIVF